MFSNKERLSSMNGDNPLTKLLKWYLNGVKIHIYYTWEF